MADLEHEPDGAEVAERARARGAYPHPVDGLDLADKWATLAAIGTALSFPDYYGGNLDALYDCATDLSWLPVGEHVVIWSHADRLRSADPAAYEGIAATLADAIAVSHNGDRLLRVVVTDS